MGALSTSAILPPPQVPAAATPNPTPDPRKAWDGWGTPVTPQPGRHPLNSEEAWTAQDHLRGSCLQTRFLSNLQPPRHRLLGPRSYESFPQPRPCRIRHTDACAACQGAAGCGGETEHPAQGSWGAGSRSRAHSWGLRPTGLHTHWVGLQSGNRPTPGLPQSTHGLHVLPGQTSRQTFPECHQGPLVLEWGHGRGQPWRTLPTHLLRASGAPSALRLLWPRAPLQGPGHLSTCRRTGSECPRGAGAGAELRHGACRPPPLGLWVGGGLSLWRVGSGDGQGSGQSLQSRSRLLPAAAPPTTPQPR